ncbi:PAS domain-containing protein [Neorhizobium sp. DT-125]|uniref:PAS domain-containing protein n=1 Tax=Neorhizobium sp. DT-125 TaxID=3396163 RepID=UPI003F1A5801
MRNQASRRIFDYWTDLRGNRAAPLRTEIDPVALRHLLPHLFIAAVDSDGLPAFRLAGTRICDLFGREFRGAAFAEAWLEGDRPRAIEIVRSVIHYEQPALLEVGMSDGDGRRDYEMLLLPVRAAEEAGSDRVLGALLPHDTPFPATRLPVSGLSLENWTFLDGHGASFVSDRPGVAEMLRRLLPARFLPQSKAS